MTGNVQIDHRKYFIFFTLTTAGDQFESLPGVKTFSHNFRDFLFQPLFLLLLSYNANHDTFSVECIIFLCFLLDNL